MSAEIWVAIITGLSTLIGVIITVRSGNSKTLYRIEQLEKKQDKHNCLIERMYKIEKDEAVIEEELEAIRQHIDDLHS